MRKYINVEVFPLRKLERLSIKTRKAELGIKCLSNCKIFNVIPKLLSFNLLYTKDVDSKFIRKRLLRSALNKRQDDKRSGVVILDRDIYDGKILEIINDTTKFKILKENPALTREGQSQRFLREIKDKNLFDKNTYKETYSCGSKPATIYGLPNTHNMLIDSNGFSLRPFISFIGTLNYNLSEFLTELLNLVLSKEHCAKDSFRFFEEMQQVSSKNNFLVSYVVCSLFTNIQFK